MLSRRIIWYIGLLTKGQWCSAAGNPAMHHKLSTLVWPERGSALLHVPRRSRAQFIFRPSAHSYNVPKPQNLSQPMQLQLPSQSNFADEL